MIDKLMRLDTVVLVKLNFIIYVSEVVPPVIIKLYVIYQVIAVEDVCLSHCLFMSVPVTDSVVFALLLAIREVIAHHSTLHIQWLHL